MGRIKLFAIILLSFLLVSCQQNIEYYLVINTDFKLVVPPNRINYLTGEKNNIYTCTWSYVPELDIEEETVTVEIKNPEVLELLSVDKKNKTLLVKAIKEGETNIRVVTETSSNTTLRIVIN